MGVEDVSSAFSSETARVLLSGSTSQQSDLIGNVISKLLKFLPQLISILALALSLAGDFLAECLFLQTFTFVTFNSVVTAQYFSWYVIFLPLVMPNLQSLSTRMLYVMVGCWSASQAVWLFCAYLLEFQGVNTYLLIWVASVVFYMINVLIIVIIILKLPKVKSTSPRAKGNKLQQVKYKK
jgi:phosphatidylinositol glycan class M